MKKFVEKVMDLCKNHKRVAMYVDMDGTIVEYPVYDSSEVAKKMETEYDKTEPLNPVIEALRQIAQCCDIDIYILSLSATKKLTAKKQEWLRRYAPFIKEENWIILTKEAGDYSPENRLGIKCQKIQERADLYELSIFLDDEHAILKETQKKLGEKVKVFHVSSVLV